MGMKPRVVRETKREPVRLVTPELPAAFPVPRFKGWSPGEFRIRMEIVTPAGDTKSIHLTHLNKNAGLALTVLGIRIAHGEETRVVFTRDGDDSEVMVVAYEGGFNEA